MTLAAARLAARLVADLDVGGRLGPWREAYLAVARHEFIPGQMWISNEAGGAGDPPVVPVDRATDPQRWLELVYSNTAVLTQFDDGQAVWPLTSGPLVSFSVDDDGAASGRVVGLCEFMSLRAQRTPLAADGVGNEDADVVDSGTDLKPWLVANEEHVRWAVGTRVPACRWWHTPPGRGRPQHMLWFSDSTSGSWASASYDRGPGPYPVRQHGPRRLWNEVEAAYRWWQDHGEPGFDDWIFTVTSHRQTAAVTAR